MGEGESKGKREGREIGERRGGLTTGHKATGDGYWLLKIAKCERNRIFIQH